jgi:biotin transporter BioY
VSLFTHATVVVSVWELPIHTSVDVPQAMEAPTASMVIFTGLISRERVRISPVCIMYPCLTMFESACHLSCKLGTLQAFAFLLCGLTNRIRGIVGKFLN